MNNSSQKTYAELLLELQKILQSVEKGETSPDQWEQQLVEVQQLLQECRNKLQGAEAAINKTLTNI